MFILQNLQMYKSDRGIIEKYNIHMEIVKTFLLLNFFCFYYIIQNCVNFIQYSL